MTLTETGVNTVAPQKRTGKITGNVDFFLYLLKMGSLNGMHSPQQSKPFLQNLNKTQAIWFSTKLQEEYALKTVDGLTAFCAILGAKPKEYDICIIDDGVKDPAWCIYKKGDTEAKLIATVSIGETENATVVATVK